MRRACVWVWLVGCSVAVDLPSIGDEESEAACSNGIDDDLDGEMDCADPACALFCFDGDSVVAPTLTPCFVDEANALAWRMVGTEPPRCEPDPDRVVPCGPGEHLPPGAESCRRVGDLCPETWPTVPEEAAAIFVRAGAVDGDGTREAPLGSLADALARATPGVHVVLAAGRYEAAPIATQVVVVGACAAQVEIAGTLEIARGAEVRLSNLTLSGLQVDGKLDAEGVWVDGSTEIIGEAAFVGSHFVRDGVGAAMSVVGAATVTASTFDVDETGIFGGGDVVLRGVAIRGSAASALTLDGHATLRGVLMELGGGAGLASHCAAPEGEVCAVLDHVVIRPAHDRANELGLDLHGPSDVRHTIVSNPRISGIASRAALRLEDVIVEYSVGIGLRLDDGADVVGVRVVLHENLDRGVRASAGSRARFIDLRVRGITRIGTTQSCLELEGDFGATRFVVTECPLCGLLLSRDTELLLTDGLIADSLRGVCLPRRSTLSLADLTTQVTYRDNQTNVFRD